MENSKIYLANLKPSTKFGETILEGRLLLDVLDLAAEEWAYSTRNKNRHLNIKVVKKQNPGASGHTHYIEVDQFIPDPSMKKDEASTEEGYSPSFFHFLTDLGERESNEK